MVPRMPITFHEPSISVACATGNSSVRTVGLPAAFSRSEPSGSTTWQCAPIQVAWRQPEAKFHWPVMR